MKAETTIILVQGVWGTEDECDKGAMSEKQHIGKRCIANKRKQIQAGWATRQGRGVAVRGAETGNIVEGLFKQLTDGSRRVVTGAGAGQSRFGVGLAMEVGGVAA